MPANVRYLIPGATYNGDGTASNEAASAGAAGAWNDTTILTSGATPTYGTLPADTVVHIRSKTGNGVDGNVVFTLATNVTWGSANATLTGPIIFTFDDGTIWSGVNGDVLVESVSASYNVTLRGSNVLRHSDTTANKLIFENRHAGCNDVTSFLLQGGASLENALFDYTKVTHTSLGPRAVLGPASAGCSLYNVRIKYGARAGANVITAGPFGSMTVDRLDIEFTVVNPFSQSNGFVFNIGTDGSRLVVNGGRIHGTGATSAVKVFNYTPFTDSGGYIFTGFSWPYDLQTHGTISSGINFDCRIEALGCDGVSGQPRQMGAIKVQRAGTVDSRNDGNHPYLNAAFNDSAATGWSWRCVPERANQNNVLDARCFKVYSDTAGAKTVTLEIQVRTSFLADNGGKVNKGNTWMTVSYVDDTTGAVKVLSTRNPVSNDNLDASTAAWSATTWGAIALTKKKLSVTTPTAVKQNSLIGVSFHTSAGGASTSDVIFVCPDPVIEAA